MDQGQELVQLVYPLLPVQVMLNGMPLPQVEVPLLLHLPELHGQLEACLQQLYTTLKPMTERVHLHPEQPLRQLFYTLRGEWGPTFYCG